MLVLRDGLVRRRDLFIYGFRVPTPVSVGLGSIAMVTRDSVLIASAVPRNFDAKELPISLGNVLVSGRVRREFCWDGNFIWPPENANSLIALVESGYALIIERTAKPPPNIIKIYRRLVNHTKGRLNPPNHTRHPPI